MMIDEYEPDDDDLAYVALVDRISSPPSYSEIANRVDRFRRWMREHGLELRSADGGPPTGDLAYRLEGFFRELE